MAAPAMISPTQPSPFASAFSMTHAPLYTGTTNAADLPHVEPLVRYQQDPIGFMVDVLGIPERTIRWSLNPGYDGRLVVFDRDAAGKPTGPARQWDGDPDPLVKMLEALRDGFDVAVEAATGTQKSFTAAAAVLWFTGSFFEARTFTFAPKEEQLRKFMWMEIGKLWPRFKLQFPLALLTDLKIRMRGVRDEAWGAFGYAVGVRAGEEVSVNAQGMHAKHMLLVYEEMPGIPPAVTEAGENTTTADHNLRLGLGNPDHQLDALHLMGHDQFGKPRPSVKAIRISALDHPNVVAKNSEIVPGAVSEKSIAKRFEKYTETGRLYKSRVRGISPAEAADALIKLEWVQRAQTMWLDEDAKRLLTNNGKADRALGVDVANSIDGDKRSIAEFLGAYCESVEDEQCPDANMLGFDVHLRMQAKRIKDERVGVDVVGVGAGTVNELSRLDHVVVRMGGKQQSPVDGELVALSGEEVVVEEKFNSPRSRWHWRLREDLRQGLIALPPDAELAVDLITPKWGTKNGVIWVESKEDIIERLGRSPNKGDSVVYANWVRDRSPLVSPMPKRKPTLAERIKKELEDMDKRDERRPTNNRLKYGGRLRQG